MCFSATASFSSAALLFSVGAGTTYLNKSDSHRMFAMTPFIFGVQQFCEGILWVTVRQNVPMVFAQQLFMILFLFIAMAIWPTWIPWSILNLETHKPRKKFLWALLAVGLFTSSLAAFALVIGPTHLRVVGHSLDYSIHNPFDFVTPNFGSLLYTSSTTFAFFISSNRIVKRMGILIFVALIITMMINKHAVTSVWCFFSAVVSFYIGLVIIARDRTLAFL